MHFILSHWPLTFICAAMIVAAVIDGWKLKVPNWLTFPLILSGWGLGALHNCGLLESTGVGGIGRPRRSCSTASTLSRSYTAKPPANLPGSALGISAGSSTARSRARSSETLLGRAGRLSDLHDGAPGGRFASVRTLAGTPVPRAGHEATASAVAWAVWADSAWVALVQVVDPKSQTKSQRPQTPGHTSHDHRS